VWSRLKRFGTIALFAAFTVGGALIIAFGEGEERIVGLVTVLFCGGGGTMWYLLTRPRPQPVPGFRIGNVSYRGGQQPAFIADYDRGHVLVASVGLLAMAAATGMFVLLPDTDRTSGVERLLIAIGGAVLFGGVGLLGLLRASRGSQLALMRDGLLATSPAGTIFVPWNAIATTGEMEVHQTRFLAVHVSDVAAIQMGRLQRLAHIAQRSMMNVDLTFPLRTLAIEPVELHAAMDRYLEHPDLRSRIGMSAELASVRQAAAPQKASLATATVKQRGPIGPKLAAGSMLVVGGLLALFTLIGAIDDATPEQQRARLFGLGLFAFFAVVQLVAGVLVIRGRQLGRWLGVGGAIAMLGLILLGIVRSDPDERYIGVILAAVVAAHLAVVSWGLRGRDWYGSRRSQPRTI
jgi:hypothetical protein